MYLEAAVYTASIIGIILSAVFLIFNKNFVQKLLIFIPLINTITAVLIFESLKEKELFDSVLIFTLLVYITIFTLLYLFKEKEI